MKKKAIIIGILVVIIMVITVIFGITMYKKDKVTSKLLNGNKNQIAYMYETGLDSHNYEVGTEDSWSNGTYILNKEKSNCEKSNELGWDNERNTVLLNELNSNKCSLYFDVKAYHEKENNNTLASVIVSKYGTSVGDKPGEELVYHDGTIDVNGDGIMDDAGDSSYRYTGDNPDNFVCFGTDDCSKDQNGEHLYRIIGVFPFTKEDGSIEYRVKLIKSEYITQEELGLLKEGTIEINNSESGMLGITPRVHKTTGVDKFQWIGSNVNNNWNNSQIKIALNSTYFDNFDSSWKNMIASTNWIIGGLERYI